MHLEELRHNNIASVNIWHDSKEVSFMNLKVQFLSQYLKTFNLFPSANVRKRIFKNEARVNIIAKNHLKNVNALVQCYCILFFIREFHSIQIVCLPSWNTTEITLKSSIFTKSESAHLLSISKQKKWRTDMFFQWCWRLRIHTRMKECYTINIDNKICRLLYLLLLWE